MTKLVTQRISESSGLGLLSNMKQNDWVKQQLKVNRQVSRNEAQRNYITRLASRIYEVKRDLKTGWKIDGKRQGRDYVYKVMRV